MNIFITGATGYLGYHFAKMALSEGHRVLCLRRLTSVSLFEPEEESHVQWVNNDDEAKLRETVDAFQPDVLFHAAWACTGGGRDNVELQRGNIDMSRRLFMLYPYRQIIALGSQAEYGYYSSLVLEDSKTMPLSKYGWAKIQTCKILEEYCEEHNIERQWIRLFTVFGEKQTGGLIKLMTEKCLAGEKVFDTTEGCQRYSLMYARDYARAICKVLGAKGKSGVYNLSQPSDIYSNRELLQRIKELLHSNILLNFGAFPYPDNQVMYMDGDVSKFEMQFGAIPHTYFDDALIWTVNFFKDEFAHEK